MTVPNPPFHSAIFYSVQNEDYETELAVLRQIDRGSPRRVLMVASSGENALSLLTQDSIAAVYAVDLNPAQLHLVESRLTASEQLSRDEQLALLGADPAMVGAAHSPARLALFDRIRMYLPEPARTFWEAARDRDLAFGIQHLGRNEVCMHDIQARLAAAGFEPLR